MPKPIPNRYLPELNSLLGQVGKLSSRMEAEAESNREFDARFLVEEAAGHLLSAILVLNGEKIEELS
jgi:hypothetical protein